MKSLYLKRSLTKPDSRPRRHGPRELKRCYPSKKQAVLQKALRQRYFAPINATKNIYAPPNAPKKKGNHVDAPCSSNTLKPGNCVLKPGSCLLKPSTCLLKPSSCLMTPSTWLTKPCTRLSKASTCLSTNKHPA